MKREWCPVEVKIPLCRWASLDTLGGWVSSDPSKLDCLFISHGVFISIAQELGQTKNIKLCKFVLMVEPLFRMQII